MALEATFRQLALAHHRLNDVFTDLQASVGDTPENDESAVADAMEDALLDVLGTLHEARKFALQAQQAVAHPANLEQARHALTRCQEHFHALEQQCASELVSFKNLNALVTLCNERRAWVPWASSIQRGLEQTKEPLEDVSKALTLCWQDLAERLGTTTISVQTSNVGQQITVAKQKVNDFEVEGVT